MDNNTNELKLFDEYTNAVTKRILSNKKKNEVCDELKSHLLEEYDRNIALGNDSETAQEKAILTMGDEKKIATQFGLLYDVSPTLYMRSSLNYIICGILLSSFQLELFTGFKQITIFIGNILLLLGIFKLRHTAKAFNKALVLLVIRFVFSIGIQIISMTLIDNTDFTIFSGMAISLYNLIIYGFLFSGINSLCEANYSEEKTKAKMGVSLVCYILFTLTILFMALYEIPNIYLFGFCLIYLITIITQLSNAKKILCDFDNEFDLNRVLNNAEKAVYVFIVILLTFIPIISMFVVSCALPKMEAYSPSNSEILQDTVKSARENLLELGLPEKVLNDLPDDEVIEYSNATHLTIDGPSTKFYNDKEFFFDTKYFFFLPQGEIRVLICLNFTDSYIAKFRQGFYMSYNQHVICDNGEEDFSIALCEFNGQTVEAKAVSQYFHPNNFYSLIHGLEFKFDKDSTNKRVYIAKSAFISEPTTSNNLFLNCYYFYERIPISANWKSMNTIAYEMLYGGMSFGNKLDSIKHYPLSDMFYYEPAFGGYEDALSGGEIDEQ